MRSHDLRSAGPAPKRGRGHALTRMWYSVAHLCARYRFVVLGVWVVLGVALVAVSHRRGDNTRKPLAAPRV